VIRAVRVHTVGRTPKPELRELERVSSPVSSALRTRRPAFFDGRFVETPVFDGEGIGHGHRVEGPAIVEERFTTIVVYPGWTAELDRHGNYVVTRD
jgi:N-methylhydantoinase A